MSLQRRKRERAEEEFQMAPMIDMVFLLLVFFMTVSTLAQAEKQVELDLPESTTSEVPDDLSDRGTVSIKADGSLFIGASTVSLEGLKQRLQQLLSTTPDLRIVVRADQETAYSSIQKVLKTCAEAGAFEVIYATVQD